MGAWWLAVLFLSAGPSGLSAQTFRTFGGSLNVDQSLIQGSDERLYGTSATGGANGAGFLFAVHTDGTGLTNLYSFPRSTGDIVSSSDAGLLQGTDGRLYGTTSGDQAAPLGGVFALNPDGTSFTMLFDIPVAALPFGEYLSYSGPQAALIQGSDGRLYGTTWGGGTAENGTIFALEPDGTGYVTLYSFPASDTPAIPMTLVEGGDGRLYGTVSGFGTSFTGTIFAINRDGTGFTALYTFTSSSDGSRPGKLIVGTDGRLYGTTGSGGAYGCGTLFALNTDGSDFTTLCNFVSGSARSLIQGNDGRLYGEMGSVASAVPLQQLPQQQLDEFGTWFSVKTDGTGFLTLYTSSSVAPTGALVQGSDGTLYGSLDSENLYALTLPADGMETAPQDIPAGGQTTLTAGVAPSGSTFQWQLNGVDIPDATYPTLSLTAIGTTEAGDYSVVVTDPTGVVPPITSHIATVVVRVDAHLVNLSARGFVGPGAESLTAGFVAGGPNAKQILVRGIGPALSQFSVTGALASPQLTLYDSTGAVIAADAGWGNAPIPGPSTLEAPVQPATAATFGQVHAFPLPAGSADCAMLAILPPAACTAQISGLNNATGVALAEVYDADLGTPASHLVNLSGLASVGAGSQALVAGFVIEGSTSETLLIRGVGPALGGFGVGGALANPVLTLYDSFGNVIAINIGWGNGPIPTFFFGQLIDAQDGLQPATASIMRSVHAFPLPDGSSDCAMVVTLPPGAYTAQVTSADGSTGPALAEIYDIP